MPKNQILTKASTIIPITEIPSTSLLGTWTLRVKGIVILSHIYQLPEGRKIASLAGTDTLGKVLGLRARSLGDGAWVFKV